jgi:hypothetical protein
VLDAARAVVAGHPFDDGGSGPSRAAGRLHCRPCDVVILCRDGRWRLRWPVAATAPPWLRPGRR